MPLGENVVDQKGRLLLHYNAREDVPKGFIPGVQKLLHTGENYHHGRIRIPQFMPIQLWFDSLDDVRRRPGELVQRQRTSQSSKPSVKTMTNTPTTTILGWYFYTSQTRTVRILSHVHLLCTNPIAIASRKPIATKSLMWYWKIPLTKFVCGRGRAHGGHNDSRQDLAWSDQLSIQGVLRYTSPDAPGSRRKM